MFRDCTVVFNIQPLSNHSKLRQTPKRYLQPSTEVTSVAAPLWSFILTTDCSPGLFPPPILPHQIPQELSLLSHSPGFHTLLPAHPDYRSFMYLSEMPIAQEVWVGKEARLFLCWAMWHNPTSSHFSERKIMLVKLSAFFSSLKLALPVLAMQALL